MAEENKECGSGLTLESALESLKQIMPAIKMIMEHTSGATAATDPAGAIDAGTVDPAAKVDKDGEGDIVKPTDAVDPPPAKEGMKEGSGMDAAEVFRAIVGQVARRDKLAKQLSAHIGTFDHSEMTEAEVAAYGVKKLGIHAAAGQEAATLTGFLLAKGDPAKQPTVKTVAAMDSHGETFVTRHLAKGE